MAKSDASSCERCRGGKMPGACVLGVAVSKWQQEPAETDAPRAGPPTDSQQAMVARGLIGQFVAHAARGTAWAQRMITNVRRSIGRRATAFSIIDYAPGRTPILLRLLPAASGCK